MGIGKIITGLEDGGLYEYRACVSAVAWTVAAKEEMVGHALWISGIPFAGADGDGDVDGRERLLDGGGDILLIGRGNRLMILPHFLRFPAYLGGT